MSWIGLAALLAVPAYAADSSAPLATEATAAPAAGVSSAPAPGQTPLSPNAAEVVKLARAGVGEEVILAYIKNCQSPFTLSADAILHLKDAGVTSPLIAAMLTRDSALRNQNPPAPFGYNQRLYPPSEQPPGAPAPPQPPPGQPAPGQPPPQPQLFAPGVAPADQTPPPAPAEVIPVSPGPDYYWAPGYWGWDNGWIWIGGGWRPWFGWGWGGWGWGGRYGWGWGGRGAWGGYHSGGFGGVHGGFGGHGGGGHGGGHGGGGHR